MVPINGNEFPIESVVKRLKEKKRFNANSIVKVKYDGMNRLFSVYYKKESLGELDIGNNRDTSINFWQKFINHLYIWGSIEYGILLAAYQLLKKNPAELDQIVKIANNKKDLKLHLGVS